MTSPHVDIVTVLYHSERWLPRCLETLRQTQHVRRILLVDHGTLSDADRKGALALDPRISYHRCRPPATFASGVNRGLDAVSEDPPDYVCIVNPDTWFEPDWLSPVLAELECPSGPSLAAPLQCRYEDNRPAEWTRRMLPARALAPEHDATVDVPWIEASCWVCRPQLFDAIGRLDPIYPLYYEDLDFCRRARLTGHRMSVVTASRYHHAGGVGSGGLGSPERTRRMDTAQAIYILTDPSHSFLRNRLRTLRWAVRRTGQWLFGHRPGVGALLPRIAVHALAPPHEARSKWQRDRTTIERAAAS